MVNILRTAAATLVAAGLALALAGCADDAPDRDDVVAKVRTDPRMAGTSEKAINCLADWYMENATVEQREAYVAGEKSTNPDEIAAVDGAVLNCLRMAAGTP
ncbi:MULTISPECIES: hypothetical protein [unclassified Plantactinospora]|uniref:hypothetical protein n=1 Tax=unclassified Plantactinospora TaxID=2631981 RepID=UPI000D1640EA|nr:MULTISPECIES: hypothetical protein [unclassified Plantactinospora]AVT30370.1 hypothetical protein C6361_13685 [Plantactinospora sp. BC1]AVT36983.1 hypothetical protein C6W10_11470 [Plantactinospora sp. BB1]